MHPARRSFWIMVLLGLLFMIQAGCGKKHLHVSTMSGEAGGEELAMGLDDSGSQNGLGTGSGLDESGLGNQGNESGASSSDDLEPLDFTHDVAPQSSAADSQAQGDQMAGTGENPDGTDQEIQTQSPSLPSMPPFGDASDDSQYDPSQSSFADASDNANSGVSDDFGSSDDIPPLVAFTNPEDTGAGNGSSFGQDTGTNEDPALTIEQVPGSMDVAKAEPSDAFREQIEEMQEQEAAALAAGLSDVFFEFDSWTLTEEGRQALETGAEWLNGKSSAKLLIEGHCDSRGTQAYNLVLGKKRAAAIRDYLVALGITPDRLSIISYGQDKPFCSDATEVCYQLNRRGHLLVQNQ